MAHGTRINGTTYGVTGGKCLVGGTAYDVKKGRTLVGGTGYDISFAPVLSPTLNDNSWEAIRYASDAGIASSIWSVGDIKAVQINGTVGSMVFSGTYYATIIGFDHNSELEGANRIHFQFGKTALSGGKDICFCDQFYGQENKGFYMNEYRNYDFTGWEGSYMRQNICQQFLGALQQDLRNVIKPTPKYSVNEVARYNEYIITSTTDYIFLLSETEILGYGEWSSEAESTKQKQYQYFANGNGKIKYKSSNNSQKAYYWSRSIFFDYSRSFLPITPDGVSDPDRVWWESYGFAPAFCV